jgi:ferrous iron transport protein B
MIALLAVVLWLTITVANIPSQMISSVLIGTIYPALKNAAAAIGLPWWLSGLLIDGVYLATAWVISVMLPPMAIFFPLFTLLEDFGYLPRVAFNLDRLFKKAGAHGKQALSMTMGFGCNAAGVVATRIIDSPRERLIAIITNNFRCATGASRHDSLATIFIGAPCQRWPAGSALAVGIAVLGIVLTFAVSGTVPNSSRARSPRSASNCRHTARPASGRRSIPRLSIARWWSCGARSSMRPRRAR